MDWGRLEHQGQVRWYGAMVVGGTGGCTLLVDGRALDRGIQPQGTVMAAGRTVMCLLPTTATIRGACSRGEPTIGDGRRVDDNRTSSSGVAKAAPHAQENTTNSRRRVAAGTISDHASDAGSIGPSGVSAAMVRRRQARTGNRDSNEHEGATRKQPAGTRKEIEGRRPSRTPSRRTSGSVAGRGEPDGVCAAEASLKKLLKPFETSEPRWNAAAAMRRTAARSTTRGS